MVLRASRPPSRLLPIYRAPGTSDNPTVDSRPRSGRGQALRGNDGGGGNDGMSANPTVGAGLRARPQNPIPDVKPLSNKRGDFPHEQLVFDHIGIHLKITRGQMTMKDRIRNQSRRERVTDHLKSGKLIVAFIDLQ